MGMRIALLAGILLIGVLLAAELWRYYADDTLVTRHRLAQRLVVGFVLQLVLAMALIGETFAPQLTPLQQLAYWSACLLGAMLALFAAIHEAILVARQYARRRAELLRGFGQVAPPSNERPFRKG
jgi:hypothetical protein